MAGQRSSLLVSFRVSRGSCFAGRASPSALWMGFLWSARTVRGDLRLLVASRRWSWNCATEDAPWTCAQVRGEGGQRGAGNFAAASRRRRRRPGRGRPLLHQRLPDRRRAAVGRSAVHATRDGRGCRRPNTQPPSRRARDPGEPARRSRRRFAARAPLAAIPFRSDRTVRTQRSSLGAPSPRAGVDFEGLVQPARSRSVRPWHLPGRGIAGAVSERRAAASSERAPVRRDRRLAPTIFHRRVW